MTAASFPLRYPLLPDFAKMTPKVIKLCIEYPVNSKMNLSLIYEK